MDATPTITPATWDALIGIIVGALTLIVPALLGIVLFWLRNVKAQLDVAHALLLQQRQELQANSAKTETIEKQTNGRLAEQIKLNMELQRENYMLKRILDALDMDAGGQQALAVARARVETMRTVRPDHDREVLTRMLRTQEPR